MTLIIKVIYSFVLLKSAVCFNVYKANRGTVSKFIEDLSYMYEDDKNSLISLAQKDYIHSYDDFYDELDNWIHSDNSMNIIFFGPPTSFMRMDTETILHILVNTDKHAIPIVKVLLAWDLVTDGKTAAFLQGREYVAFGSLLNVVPEEDLYYVNFGDPSVLNYFANYYINMHPRKMGILITSYRRYFGDKWYSNGSFINDLGYMICGFPTREIGLISFSVFMEINVDIFNKLIKCSIEQRMKFYNTAIHTEAYGRPYRWSSHEISKLGSLITCISDKDISSITLEAVSAITAEVMKKIKQNKLQYFSKEQITRFNAKARRIYILRMQLRHSLDMSMLVRKDTHINKPQAVCVIFLALINGLCWALALYQSVWEAYLYLKIPGPNKEPGSSLPWSHSKGCDFDATSTECLSQLLISAKLLMPST